MQELHIQFLHNHAMRQGGKNMKKLLMVLMRLMLLVMAAGCGGSGEKKSAEQPKVLKVGTEPTFAPFEFQEKGSKEFVGFDMDLIRAIGKQLNMQVEIQNMGFDALIPALNAGNIDVAAAGMSITPDRQKAVDMSDPYYVSGLTIVVNKDNNAIKGLKDLEGKGIAVQIGTTGADKAAKVKGSKVKTFNTNAEVFLELKNKGVPYLNGKGARGDQFITVNVAVPKRLNSKQKELLREFAASMGPTDTLKGGGIFGKRK